MEMSNNIVKVTTQGRDTPVSVGVGSGRAGSPRPSSFDCPVPPGEYQTGGHSTITGRERKRLSLIIPPTRHSFSAPTTPVEGKNLMTLDLTWDEDEGTSKKRKLRDSPKSGVEGVNREATERMATKARRLVKDIEGCSRVLCQLIRENPNTKREVKEATQKLRSMTSHLVTEDMQALLQSLGKQPVTSTDSAATCIGNPIPTKDGCTQTDPISRPSLTLNEDVAVAELSSEVDKGGGLDHLRLLIGRKWPVSVYKSVTLKQNNPLAAPPDHDAAVVLTGRSVKDRGLFKCIRDRYPELEEAINDREAAHAHAVSVSTKTETKIGDCVKVNEKTLYVIDAGKESEEDIDISTVFESLLDIRTKLEGKGRKNLALAWDVGAESDTLKKTAEFIFRNTDIRDTLCIPARRTGTGQGKRKTEKTVTREYGVASGETSARQPPTNKARQTKQPAGPPVEQITVLADGQSYAEMLRSVRKEVAARGLGTAITGARKSERGNLLLTANGSASEINALKVAIASQVNSARIRHNTRSDSITLHIRDLDSVTEREEVMKALQDTVREDLRASIEVKPLRPSFADTQTATAIVPREAAIEILKRPRTRIGMVLCRVRERVEVPSCYKCWGYGHQVKSCRGVDRRECCLNCGQKGHQAKDCPNERFCPTCGAKGQKAGGTGCPLFRRAIKEASNPLGDPNATSSQTPMNIDSEAGGDVSSDGAVAGGAGGGSGDRLPPND